MASEPIEISLPCGSKCLIDKKDLWILKIFSSWRRVRNHVRVVRHLKTKYGTAREEYYLHRLIVKKVASGFEIDHINRNGLDNRRINLRVVTHQKNMFNTSKQRGTHSKYRGVTNKEKINKNKPWHAYIKHNGKMLHLGYFKSELEAAKAYDLKSKELRGEFAFLNFPQ